MPARRGNNNMTKRLRILFLAAFTLLLIFISSQLCNAWWLRFTIGQMADGSRGADVQVGDQDAERFRTQVVCDFCHKADEKKRVALTQPYDVKSQLNHQQTYFKERAMRIDNLTKYVVDRDIYLTKERNRLVLVNGRENYKLTFAEDVVVLLDDQKRPAFIYGIKDYIKTKIDPTPLPPKK
jgi:hypothetical protein